MPEETKYACQRCTRTDLTLTANGKIRSHAANGKRASADNPHCPGGSYWPKHDHDYQFETSGEHMTYGYVCTVCGENDPRPSSEELRNAEYAIASPGVPDEVFEQAESIIQLAAERGVRPDRAAGPSVVALPTGTATGGPNPHRPPLSTGSAAQDRARGIPAEEAPPRGAPSDADALMDGEVPEGDDSPSYFAARYDGDCDTCGRHFDAGDMIRKSPDGGWEAEDCCGSEIDEETGQKPQSTAPQLPVRNGRYQGPNPDTGKATSWMRSTKFAEGVADQFNLTLWQLRMAGMGLALRPDLLSKISDILQSNAKLTPYEIAKSQREIINMIMEDAKLTAGSKDRARKGTILHKHTQEIDMGRKSLGDVPSEFRVSVNAYLKAMTDSGLTCIPDLIERSTMCATLKVAGTFDRILHVTRDLDPVTFDDGRTVQLHEGDFVIGDVKSGQDLSYAWPEILIQLAVYAHGVDETGVAVPDRSPQGKVIWRWADLAEFGIEKLRTDVGIVMHMPYGERSCDLHYADLVTGWRGAKISQNVAEYQKTTMPKHAVASYSVPAEKTFTPAGGQAVSVAQTIAGTGDVVSQREIIPGGVPATRPRRTWEDVARAVSTKEEANKVWAEMSSRKATIGMTRINSVVAIMRKTLQEKGVV